MSRFIESIRIVNGRMMNKKYHQDRINRTFNYEGKTVNLFLDKIELDNLSMSKVHKLRIEYNTENNNRLINVIPYIEKPINSLQVVYLDDINYDLKYADRNKLDKAYAKKNGSDDILICRNNQITDSYYCNVAFFNGNKWLTPKYPLLKGTMRQKLMDKGIIETNEININDIQQYKIIRLFNAMIPWSNKKDIKIKNVNI